MAAGRHFDPHDTLVGIKIVFRIARHLEIEGSGHPPERRDLLEVLQPIQNLLLRRLDVLDGNDVASQSIAADRMNGVKNLSGMERLTWT